MGSVNVFEGTVMIMVLLFLRFGLPASIMWATNLLYGRYTAHRLSH